jgi:putative Mg2+ transporter-C (MgtC) family protein
MSGVELVMVIRLLAAIVAGGLIGLERSLHGRPAGFRTHTLVCAAAAALMLVAVDQGQWAIRGSGSAISLPRRSAPTRRAWRRAS